MEQKTLVTKVAVCMVVLLVGVLFGVALVKNGTIGTQITQNTATESYTDGGDLYQNVQAIAERMAGLTEGQLLQADSQGRMQAVAPGSLAGVFSVNQYEEVESVTANNTLTVAESGTTFFLSGATATTTLATSTPAGQVVRFYVGGALSGDHVIITSGGEDVIEGSLIVAGAVVDCASEDRLTFVSDGENVGDFFELRSTGTGWLIGASGALTSSKLTCTTS